MTEVGLGEKEGGGACQEDSSAAEDSILRMGRAAGSSYTGLQNMIPVPEAWACKIGTQVPPQREDFKKTEDNWSPVLPEYLVGRS